jgi:hypothetical protein
MEIRVKRVMKNGKATIGEMTFEYNGRFFCYTLEDTDRGLKQSDPLLVTKAKKLFGVTAIPAGRYEVVLNYSNRFKKYMPQILNVPGFEGVRIHCGNKPEDTEGCILVGMDKGIDTITKSRIAYDKLMEILQAVEKTSKVFITID